MSSSGEFQFDKLVDELSANIPDEKTRAVVKEMESRNQYVSSHPDYWQSPEDVAAVIEDIIVDDKPDLRRQTNKLVASIAAGVWCDPTGNTKVNEWLGEWLGINNSPKS